MAEPVIDSAQLVELDALLRSGSVTAAARALGRSESAMRAALVRLRKLLGDRLWVRAGGTTRLTPRARALAGPVRASVVRLGALASVRTELCIAATDYVQCAVIPALAQAMSRDEPGIALRVVPIDERALLQQLARGTVDLAVGLFGGIESGAGLRRRRLFEDRFACVMRADHPVARALDLDSYTRIEHVSVSTDARARGVVDELLARLGRSRAIALTVPSLGPAVEAVASSDCVLTVPERAGRALAARGGLVLVDPPLKLPAIPVFALWHERSNDNAARKWAVSALVTLGAVAPHRA